MRFDKILIMGANRVACDCARILSKEIDTNKILALETANNQFSMFSKICNKSNISYTCLTDKEAIFSYLDTLTSKKVSVLIISANNRYIFKNDIILKPNVEIINFHYSLLPKYRGSNIPTWVIYNGEKETGITWHYVTEQVDHGDILAQRIIKISNTTTAFDITRNTMELSGTAFTDFYKELLERHVEGVTVEYPQNAKVYMSKELPNNGYITVNMPIDLIDRTLRAYDYHGFTLLPALKFRHNDNEYIVKSYDIEHNLQIFEHKISISDVDCCIQNNGMKIKINFEKVTIN